MSEWDSISTRVRKAPSSWDDVSQAVMPDETDAEAARLHRTGKTLANQYRIGDTSTPAGVVEELAGGAKHAWDRASLGLKGLVTDLSPADQMLLDQGSAFVKDTGPASTVGQVGADVLMSAGPVGVANRGLQAVRGASALPNAVRSLAASRYAVPATDIAANAGYGYVTAPEDRAGSALLGAGGAAGGRILSKALANPVRVTPQAQALLDQGVNLTPGQAGTGLRGSFARFSEGAAEPLPFAGPAITGAKDQAVKDWNKELIRASAPKVAQDLAGVSAPDTIDGLRTMYDRAYKKLFPPGRTVSMDGDMAVTYQLVTADLANGVAPSARPKFREVAFWVGDHLKTGVDASQWKEVIEKEIDGAIQTASRDGANSLVQALKALDTQVKQALVNLHGNPQVLEALDKVDAGYHSYKILQKAGARQAPIKRGGTLYPTDVLAAARGSPALTERAVIAHQVFGNPANAFDKTFNLGKTAAVAAAGGLGHITAAIPPTLMAGLSATQWGRSFLLGKSQPFGVEWQKFVRKNPDLASQLGRALSTQQNNGATP